MTQKQFDIPILFIIFRRKDTALQVIDAIAKVKPKKLYISQDGPRNEQERKEVLETRKAVLSRINWKCDLTLWTHKNNLGLKRHIPQAFDRVFKKEKWCIYLEDDTLPELAFFKYQYFLLNNFLNDNRVFAINGTNLCSRNFSKNFYYRLSQIGHCWGMGIWKRSWLLYRKNLDGLQSFDFRDYRDFIFSKKYFYYLKFFINLVSEGKLNTWDYQLSYSAIRNKMYFISPSINLVRNIGINDRGSHVFLDKYDLSDVFVEKINFKKKLMPYSPSSDLSYFNCFYKYFYPRIFLNLVFYNLPSNFRKLLLFLTNEIKF